MERPAYPSDLTDAQWEIIEPLLPPLGESTFCETVPRREIVNGIRYVMRSGCQWRMMPHDLPHWNTVYTCHRQWCKDGVWKRINDALVALERERKGRKAKPSAAVGDSQSVKTTQKGGIAAMTGPRRLKAANATLPPIPTGTC